MHYVYTDKPYNSKSHKSRAKCVISDFKKYEPKYTKNNSKIIIGLISKLDIALRNAELSMKTAKDRKSTNPSSNLHLLIEELRRQEEKN
ncbi:hypothetical protein A9G43_05940 [Gilliamella sp. Occ3-1]|nr:hypothetical protein A9G43_05940 [Gilliamella apicola]